MHIKASTVFNYIFIICCCALSLLKRILPSGLSVTNDLLRLLTKSTTTNVSKIDMIIISFDFNFLFRTIGSPHRSIAGSR